MVNRADRHEGLDFFFVCIRRSRLILVVSVLLRHLVHSLWAVSFCTARRAGELYIMDLAVYVPRLDASGRLFSPSCAPTSCIYLFVYWTADDHVLSTCLCLVWDVISAGSLRAQKAAGLHAATLGICELQPARGRRSACCSSWYEIGRREMPKTTWPKS